MDFTSSTSLPSHSLVKHAVTKGVVAEAVVAVIASIAWSHRDKEETHQQPTGEAGLVNANTPSHTGLNRALAKRSTESKTFSVWPSVSFGYSAGPLTSSVAPSAPHRLHHGTPASGAWSEESSSGAAEHGSIVRPGSLASHPPPRQLIVGSDLITAALKNLYVPTM